MNEVVLDASVVLRWAFDDETDRDGAIRVADALEAGWLRPVVPPIFFAEVAGVLVRAVRASRIERETAEGVFAALLAVGVEADEPHADASLSMRLALDHGLRLQDAMYVEAARRRGVPLVSADTAQLAAATAMGLRAIPVAEVPAWIPDSP